MNRLRGQISRMLLLLAAVMLPIQQTLAANCCCRQGHHASQAQTAGLRGDCCTSTQPNCCGGGSGHSCCQNGTSESGSKPCNCPSGCCGKIPPDVIDPVTIEVITADDLVTVAIVAPQSVPTDGTQVAHFENATPPTSRSGSQRCVLLCRYRL